MMGKPSEYQYTQTCLWHYFSGTNFEDLFASLTWPCTLPPGWSVEWDGPSVGANHPPAE